MKILFIRSGNSGTDPISTSQGMSLRTLGPEVIFFDLEGRGIKGYLSNIPRIRHMARLEKPDLLHAHYSLSGIVAALACTGIPCGVSLMGSDVNASGAAIRSLLRLFAFFSWKFVIVKSDEMYRKLGIRKAAILPNGVDRELFYPMDSGQARARLHWDPAKKHILFASDPERPEKNYALARTALDLLEKEAPPFDVHFLQGIPFEEVVYHYNAADVLLLTSRHEGSPNVIKEAMACNCPIVATNVGDVADVTAGTAQTCVTGFSAPPIAEALKTILSTPARSDGRGRIDRYDSRKIAEKLAEIYRKTLQHG